VVSVEGEAGVGKTRLVGEALRTTEASERRILVGRCHPIRESFPLGPVVEAVRGLGRDLAGIMLGPVAGAVRGLLPELADRLPAAPEPLDDRLAERHRVFRGLAELLGALGPSVLVLEDLHWADEQTADFVNYLLADPLPELVVVLTFRGEQASPTVRALDARLPDRLTRARLLLDPLNVADTGALMAGILGTDQISDEFASYVWQRTGGLPFAVEEVLALVRALGVLVPGPDGTWSRRALAELGVPAAIRDSTLERVARLPSPCRRIAEAAAVLQTPVPVTIVQQVVWPPGGIGARPVAGFEAALDQVVRSGLLVEDGRLVGFRHVLAAEAVYEALSGPSRRALHGQAAKALRMVTPVPLGQVAHHLRHAGQLAEWADAAERAAAQGVAMGHDDEAARLLTDVLRDAPLDTEQRGRLAIMLGRAAIEALHAPDAAALLEQTLEPEAGMPRPTRGELRFYLAVMLNRTGTDLDRQRQLLTDAVADLDHRPDLRAWAMVSLGIATSTDVPLAEDLYWLHRAVDLAAGLDDPLVKVFVLGLAGAVLLEAGDPGWRPLADRVPDIVGDEPRSRREANAYCVIGMSACYAGDLETASTFMFKARTAPVLNDDRRLELIVRSGAALLDYCRGDWDGLDTEADALHGELTDYPTFSIDVDIVAGCLALAHGHLDEAGRRLHTVLNLCRELGGHGPQAPFAAAAVFRLAVARGDHDTGISHLRAVQDTLATKGQWAPIVRVLPAAVDLLIAAGAELDALALTDRAEKNLRNLDAPLGSAALTHARGLLAAAAGDPPTAARLLLAAAEQYSQRLCRYDAAQATEAAAHNLLAAGDPKAGAALRTAAADFRTMGASWDVARAARLGRQHGIRLAAPHRGGRRGYGTRLSPRERQVAELAAAGQTNKEISEELFLSPNTVDIHISAVLRKLGVRSRVGIGPRLAETDPGRDTPRREQR
jgi:DNA-binding NarL/FixJ family response regulator